KAKHSDGKCLRAPTARQSTLLRAIRARFRVTMGLRSIETSLSVAVSAQPADHRCAAANRRPDEGDGPAPRDHGDLAAPGRLRRRGGRARHAGVLPGGRDGAVATLAWSGQAAGAAAITPVDPQLRASQQRFAGAAHGARFVSLPARLRYRQPRVSLPRAA